MSTQDGQSRTSRASGWLEPGSQGHGKGGSADTCTRFPLITKQKWTGIIESTVHASVEELTYMKRIRFSISSKDNKFDTDDPKSSCASHENLLSVGNKSKIPRDSEDLRAQQNKMEANQW